jgi:hypothetical protein
MPKRSASPSVATTPAVAWRKNEVAEGEIFFADVGTGAVEEHVAVGSDRFHGDAVVGENFVEVACAAAVESVNGEFLFGIGEDVESYELFDAVQIIRAEVGCFCGRGVSF